MRTTPLILLMLLANFLQKKKSKSLIKKTEIKRAFKKKIDPVKIYLKYFLLNIVKLKIKFLN